MRRGWSWIIWGTLCGTLAACGSVAETDTTLHVPYAHLDRSHSAVVHLSSDCSGTLVRSDRVLTSAHCVVGEGALEVDVLGPRKRLRRFVSRCRLHPAAFGGRRFGCAAERRIPRRPHDLAVLWLDQPVPSEVATPHPIAFRRPVTLRDERIELVGWFRHPFAIGTPRRYAGWNRIVAARGPLLQTMPEGEPPFRTRMGSSGGPALLGERIVGVLHGGERADSPDSVYVATYAGPNARWIRRALR